MQNISNADFAELAKLVINLHDRVQALEVRNQQLSDFAKTARIDFETKCVPLLKEVKAASCARHS